MLVNWEEEEVEEEGEEEDVNDGDDDEFGKDDFILEITSDVMPMHDNHSDGGDLDMTYLRMVEIMRTVMMMMIIFTVTCE